MYTIEKKDYGIKIVFKGEFDLDETKRWWQEMKALIDKQTRKFAVLCDVHEAKLMSQEGVKLVEEAQRYSKEKGSEKNVTVLSSVFAKLQQTRIAKHSGLYAYMRYLDAESVKDPEAVAVNWFRNNVDPDAR